MTTRSQRCDPDYILVHTVEDPMRSHELLARVDHLVYATGELDRGVAEIERILGIRASWGGRHPTWGTRNALAAVGPRCYLEATVGARPFGLDEHGPSRLVGWAANATELKQLRIQASQRGVTLGDVQSGNRQLPDGTVLRWMLTDLCCVVTDAIIPFFIDWGQSPHPASAAPAGAMLVSLRAEHPQARQVREMLRGFDLKLPVTAGCAPQLVAEIDSPKGRVLLR